jgi:hypothetical protein
MKLLSLLLATLVLAIGCQKSTTSADDVHKLGAVFASSPPTVQPSWSQATWFIDPANSSGCASDVNKTGSLGTCGTSGDGPLLTYAQLAARWGTYSPRIRQNTTITFLSSQTSDLDPVYVNFLDEAQALVAIQCALPAPVATGTLSGVVAKNRSTGQLLNATLSASAAANQLIVNTTHPSRAFVQALVSGTTWAISQPLAPEAIPIGSVGVSEVDTWANGDAYAVYVPYSVDFADLEPTAIDNNAANTNNFSIYQCTASSPTANAVLTINQQVSAAETVFLKTVALATNPSPYPLPRYPNDDFVNGIIGGIVKPVDGFNNAYIEGTPAVYAGQIVNIMRVAGARLDADVIINTGITSQLEGGDVQLVYIGASSILTITGQTSAAYPAALGHILWGPGALDVTGSARLSYTTGTATASFLQTGGFKINETATACSHTGAAPDVVSCGITLSGANLDAAQSTTAFGGLAYSPGGGSIAIVP